MQLNALVTAVVLIVRVYHTDDVPPTDALAAEHHAGEVLRTAGLTPEWVNCTMSPTTGHCAEAGRTPTLILRIVADSSPPANPSAFPLGFSAVSPGAPDPPILATVYGDRVAALARAVGVDRLTLLGRAAAHEIGHVLLGRVQHARRGVMRPVWSASELRRNRPEDWLFLPSEAAAMRAAALGRSTPSTLTAF